MAENIFQVEAHIDTLVSEQASFVLNQSGLAYLFGTVQQHQPKQVKYEQEWSYRVLASGGSLVLWICEMCGSLGKPVGSRQA